MGARDTEEQLDACKADAILLERQLAAAEAKLAAIDALCSEPSAAATSSVDVGELRVLLSVPPAGVLLTPEEAAVLADAARRCSTDPEALGTSHGLRALATRLEEATLRA